MGNLKKKAAKIAANTEKKSIPVNGNGSALDTKGGIDKISTTTSKRSNRSRFTTKTALHESENDFLYAPFPTSQTFDNNKKAESVEIKTEENNHIVDYIVDEDILTQHLQDIKEEYENKIQELVGKSQSDDLFVVDTDVEQLKNEDSKEIGETNVNLAERIEELKKEQEVRMKDAREL